MASRPAPSYSNPDPHAVAILGLSLCAPGGEAGGLDTEEFFEFLKRRGSGIITVPSYRWNGEAFHGSVLGKACTVKGGFIPDFEYADIQEFGITAAEAGQAFTTHFTVLHQAFNALQRSGVDYRATNTGVFVGCPGGATPFDVDLTQAGAYFMTGTSLSITANRINYVFDLLGPSTIVDTACSSSLTAIHLAVQAIRNGDCDQAVVAGVNLIASPADTIAFSHLGVLSPDGISKSFDNDADGYARADSAGAVVIKRHDLAVRDNDVIHATLVGSALTSCGSLMGSLTTPNPEAQAQAIRRAYADAGLQPHQANFVELHGTGTVVGDSMEANAAGEVFSEGRQGKEILIGSVKSNVGHGEISAYMTSLVKIVLMLEHKQVLPNGYFEKPSEKIDFEKYNLRVPVESEEFITQDSEQGLIASISSFGFGGSCGHTVLREHEKRPVRPTVGFGAIKGPFLFTMGALTPKSCNALLREYKNRYTNADFHILCEHLGRRTRQMPYRTYAIADTFESATFPEPSIAGKRPNPLVFCFSGQGPQHWRQGRELMAAYPAFRDSVLACDRVYEAYVGESFIQKTGLFLQNPTNTSLETSMIWPADVITVSITFYQIAMFDFLTALGVQPTALVGHSLGETATYYASGAIPREMAVKLAVARGRALSLVDNTGGSMIAISGGSPDAIRDYIDAASYLAGTETQGTVQLYLTAFNSPTDVGVSGPEKLLNVLTDYINRWVDGAIARKLRVSTAVHSPFVNPCEEVYRKELAAIFSEHPGDYRPTIPTVSTVTGKFVSEPLTVDYLWKNVRQPVLFSTAIQKIVAQYGDLTTFVEVSPHPVLSQYIQLMGAHDSIGTGERPPSPRQLKAGAKMKTEVHAILDTIGHVLLCGLNSINFTMLNAYPSESLSDIDYPFNKKFWPFAGPQFHPASYQRWLLPATRALNSTRLRVGPSNPEPWMAQHIIDRSNLIPASAYVEMGLEFPNVTEVWDCKFENVCILDESLPPVTLEVSKEGVEWFIKSSTSLQTMRGDSEWLRQNVPPFDTIHARGKLGYGVPKVGPDGITFVDIDAAIKRCYQIYTKEEWYLQLGAYAQFGDEFKRINRSCMNETESVTWIRGHADGLNTTDYNFHPAILDAVFQAGLSWGLLFRALNDGTRERNIFLPHSLKRAFRNDGSLEPLVLPSEFLIYAVLDEWAPHAWIMNAYVLDENGSVQFTVEGLRFAWVSQEYPLPSVRYSLHWQPYALPLSQAGGLNALERPLEQEAVKLLTNLDKLVTSHVSIALGSIPEDFSPEVPDPKGYLTYWKNVVANYRPEASANKYWETQSKEILQLVRQISGSPRDVLTSNQTASKLLPTDDIMDRVYESPPFTEPIFDDFVKHFMKLINAAFTSGKRVVRVLEVGARHGHLTKLLGQALVDAALDPGYYIDYFCSYTDIVFSQKAAVKSPWMTMTPVVFDPTVPVEEQILEPASFDIIVAFNALYCYSDKRGVLLNLKDMLVPGGYLAAVELDGNSFAASAIGTKWITFLFSSIYGDSLPLTALPLPDWTAVLDSAGYSNHLSLSTSNGNCVEHIAFITQASPSKRMTNGFSNHIAEPNPQDDDLTVIQHFSAGDEVKLVELVSVLDSTQPYSLWLHTEIKPSNAALLGLSRSLCHEYSAWKICTVLFPPSWDSSRQKRFIYDTLIPLKLVHAELMVNESGQMSVPRIVEAPALSITRPRESKAVQFDATQIWLHYPPELSNEDVEVAVSFVSISPISPGCSEFSGLVTAVGKDLDHNLIGKRVFGIVPGHSGSVVVCPQAKVSVIPDGLSLSAAAALVGRLAFLSSVILNALPTSKRQCFTILHAGDCSAAAAATYSYLQAAGFKVLITATESMDHDTTAYHSKFGDHVYASNDHRSWVEAVREQAPKGVDLVISFDPDPSIGTETTQIMAVNGTLVQVIGDAPSRMHRGQKSISVDWNFMVEEGYLLSNLEDIPLGIRDSLSASIKIFDLSQLSAAHKSAYSASPSDATLLSLETIDPELRVTKGGIIPGTSIFNPRACYVLIGGIGGLGVGIAYYMVQNGARHIVLTSRSGMKTLKSADFLREKQMITYLCTLPSVTVDLVAVDCLDTVKTKELFSNLNYPIAGVFFLPVKLHDQLFVNLKSEEDWKCMYDVKVKGLEVLIEAVDPASLDFLVLTSTTSAISGSAGQANYTAAQIQMETIGAGLPNTISVAVPPILDAGVLARSMGSGNSRNAALEKYKSFGASARLVVQQCFDAILSLDSFKLHNSIYVPDMDWKILRESGLAERSLSLIHHLLVKDVGESFTSGTSYDGTIRAVCAKVLSLDVDEMDETMPLSSYGLDSLTAGRLKGILKAQFNLEVTQLQLLSSYLTVERLLSMQIEQAVALEAEQSATDDQDAFSAETSIENDMNQTVISLNEVKHGSPVFLVHGAGGGVLVMRKIAQKIQVPVYGVQDTPDAPLTGTLQTLASFYLEQVKKKQAKGPYRLGGFSFGTAVAVVMAQMLRESGETVEALIMLDGAPTLFHRPMMRRSIRQMILDGTMKDSIMRIVGDMVASGSVDDAEDIIVQFEEHFEGLGSHKWVARFCQAYTAHLLMGIRESDIEQRQQKGDIEGLVWPAEWTVLMKAQNGAQVDRRSQGASEAFDLDKWTDKVQIFEFPGSHFGLLNPASGVGEALNAILT